MITAAVWIGGSDVMPMHVWNICPSFGNRSLHSFLKGRYKHDSFIHKASCDENDCTSGQILERCVCLNDQHLTHSEVWRFRIIAHTTRHLDAMRQERRVVAIERSTYEEIPGTQVKFICRRNQPFDIYNGPYFATGVIPMALAQGRKRWFDNEVVVENIRCQAWQVLFAARFCECLHFEMTSLILYLRRLWRRASQFCNHSYK
jgi:hypothetical protein